MAHSLFFIRQNFIQICDKLNIIDLEEYHEFLELGKPRRYDTSN